MKKNESIVGTRIGIYDVLYECDYKAKDGHKLYHIKCSECGWETDMPKGSINRATCCTHQKKEIELKKCLNCDKEISHKNKYCSNKCQREYEQKQWKEKWLNGETSGNCNGIWQDVRDRVRNYLFKKYDNKCSRCGWGEVNPYTGKIPLEIEHIDGNAENTTPENVTLLCPNCHSLTATYRGANRGNGRPKTWIPKTELDV